jgi:SnoaL-like domain
MGRSPMNMGRNIMNRRTTGTLIGMAIAFVLTWPTVAVFSQAPETDSVKDRIEIQEKLIYAYAYTYDSKDCESWSNLFTTDAIREVSGKESGRDAIRQYCIARQKNVVGNIKTRHNMMNIVFDHLTLRRAETRTYFILTWQKPGEQTITVQATGTYKDVIVKSDDGRWLFKERKRID